MEIKLENKTIDGKYQRLIFAIFDINDFLGRPICFIIGDNNTIRNFTFDVRGWDRSSTKYEFAKIIMEAQTGKTIIPNFLGD